LLTVAGRHPAFQEIAAALTRRERGPLHLSGLTTTAKALYLTLLWQATERPIVLVTGGSKQAEALQELVSTFFDLLVHQSGLQRPQLIPALDVIPSQRMSPHSEISGRSGCGGSPTARPVRAFQ
jgi:transcription-repair coupling factor (superfamily II helicase)